MKDYWVYMLLCSDGSYYTGITNDIDRRVAQHNSATIPGCYTQTRLPTSLAYCSEVFHDVNDAIAWEKRIKGWSRSKKAALARGDWEEIKRLSKAKQWGPRAKGL